MIGAVRAVVASLVVSLALLLVPSFARAQDGATLVAIVTPDPTSSLTRRVRTELEALGVDVIVIKPPAESTPAKTPLEQAARGVGAIAAVRLVTSGAGVEVWVADRATGKAVVRELVAPKGEGAASDAFFAVGVVELLRASLMELHTSEPHHGDAPVTVKTLALALPSTPSAPSIPRIGLAVGGGTELGIRGLGPSVEATLGIWVHVKNGFGIRGFGAMTLVDASVRASNGAVDVASQRFGLEAAYDLNAPTARWVPTVGIGAMGAHVGAKGTAVAPFIGESANAWAAGPTLHAGLGLTVANGLRLRVDAVGAWTLPTPQIYVLDRKVGQFGAPLVGFSFAIELLSGLG